MPTPEIIFEYHDINIENFRFVAKYLNTQGDNKKWNLMVIPFCENHSTKDFTEFKTQLSKWKISGFNLYIHGYKHIAEKALQRSVYGRILLFLTKNEAEFAGLNKGNLQKLLEKSIEAWKDFGIGEPTGFVAPTWHAPRSLLNLCKESGFSEYGGRFVLWSKRNVYRLSLPFSLAGLPKFILPAVKLSEKLYLKLYSVLRFLPVPRIVYHP